MAAAIAIGVGGRAVVVVVPPGRVAVAREVEGDERAAERQRHRVPRVGVLGAAVEEHELGRRRRPTRSALSAVVRPTDARTVGGPS